MIHISTFSGRSEQDCIDQINRELNSDKIINVIPRGVKSGQGWDEYDTWSTYFMEVIYKD